MDARPAPKPTFKKRRESGYISPATKRAVKARAQQHCEECGVYLSGAWHFHHVGGKGMGGTRREFGPAEVKLLCRRCHFPNGHHRKDRRAGL